LWGGRSIPFRSDELSSQQAGHFDPGVVRMISAEDTGLCRIQ
jgi:hypothetical protein